MFFCAIRSRGGHNDNPTARQFESSYKRLLGHVEIKISKNANATEQSNCNILKMSSSKIKIPDPFPNITCVNPHLRSLNLEIQKIMDEEYEDCDYDSDEDEDLRNVHTDVCLNRYISNIVTYIAGFVKRTLKKKIKCENCLTALDGESYELQENKSFILRKNRGGLELPSKDLVEICTIGEKSFKLFKSNLFQKNSFEKIILYSMRLIPPTLVFENMNEHIMNQYPFDNHQTTLIKSILFEYLKIRFHRTASIETEKLRENFKRSIH